MAKKLTFKSKLFRLAEGMEYYAMEVPAKTSLALKTKKAVPVAAKVNGSETFIASLYPVGGGRHNLRVRNKICKSVGITAGDAVKVEFTIRDHKAESGDVPKDVMAALKAEGVADAFKAIPPGQKSFILRQIEKAAKPETRKKRIKEAIDEAYKRREKLAK